MPNYSNGLFALAALIALTGCATTGSAPEASAAGEQRQYPRNAVVRHERGVEEMREGDDAQAIEAFVALSKDYPDYAGPLVNLGILYRRSGRADASEAVLKRAIALCSDCAPGYNELGILYRQQGRFDEAERAYLAAIDADPDYPLAWLNLGMLYDLYQRRLPDAIVHYEQYLKLGDDEAQVRTVEKWITDLRRRAGTPGRAAQNGAAG